jgi:hypothetical protein
MMDFILYFKFPVVLLPSPIKRLEDYKNKNRHKVLVFSDIKVIEIVGVRTVGLRIIWVI